MISIQIERHGSAEGLYRIDLPNDEQIYAKDRSEAMIAVDHYFGGNGHTQHNHPQCPICRHLSARAGDGRWGEGTGPDVMITCDVQFVETREIALRLDS